MRSPELLALQHNLTFPESATASPVTLRRAHRCRRFSVDLSEMRSLRLFFADSACTCGQLVVASRESQYKILHFHHGGLDRLAATLHQWHQLLYPRLDADTEETLPYRYVIILVYDYIYYFNVYYLYIYNAGILWFADLRWAAMNCILKKDKFQ